MSQGVMGPPALPSISRLMNSFDSSPSSTPVQSPESPIAHYHTPMSDAVLESIPSIERTLVPEQVSTENSVAKRVRLSNDETLILVQLCGIHRRAYLHKSKKAFYEEINKEFSEVTQKEF
jgi:hypothetical protein